jgi:hypothetical protein
VIEGVPSVVGVEGVSAEPDESELHAASSETAVRQAKPARPSRRW